MFTAGYFWDAFLYTLFLAAVTTVLISIIAFPCAYALAFKVSPAIRRLGVFFLLTPFFTSFIVRVYSWQVILSNDGILNSGFAAVGLGPFDMLNNSFSTIVGFFTLAFPLVILLHLLSLANVDRSLIEAAHNLRCGRIMTVFLIIIPAARVGLTLAACFAFLLSFGEYLSPCAARRQQAADAQRPPRRHREIREPLAEGVGNRDHDDRYLDADPLRRRQIRLPQVSWSRP